MQTEDFNFHLPPELIAQFPAVERDQSRLLVLDRVNDRFAIRGLLSEPGSRLVYESAGLVVVGRSPSRNAR